MLSYRVVTPPAVEPVSLQQMKKQLKQDFPDDDDYILALITAARQYAEKYCNRAFFDQTMALSLDAFPIWGYFGTVNPAGRKNWYWYSQYWDPLCIRLPRPRCVSVTSITFTNLLGTLCTVPAEAYAVDITSEPARIVPQPSFTWPSATLYLPGSVTVNYVAGSYGDGTDVNDCPQTIVQAIMLLVNHWYRNRSAASEANLKNIPLGVNALLDSERFETYSYESGY